MKARLVKSRSRNTKPVKRTSVVRRKKTRADVKQYLIRCWWIFRGAAAGVLALCIFYGIYIGAGIVMDLDSLAVRNIEVDGCTNIQPDHIKLLAGVSEGDPLLKVNLKEVRKRVLAHPSVKDAAVTRELPDLLRISIMERMSAAVILGAEFARIDSEGVVLDLSTSYPEGYPVITGISEPLVPGKASAGARSAMEILRSLSNSGLVTPDQISELGVEEDRIRVSLMGSGTVLMIDPRDVDGQIAKLSRLIQSGVFDVRSAGYDLRFEGRVIGLPERSSGQYGKDNIPRAGG